MKGKLIVFEGLDGVGKSTAIRGVECGLLGRGVDAKVYSGYNSTPGVEEIRNILNSRSFCQTSEILLFFASHVEHASKTIAPALAQGQTVLMDRFYFSTLAYQGHYEKCGALYDSIKDELLTPDVVLYLKAPTEVRNNRLLAYRDFDEIEARDTDYFDRVEQNYDRLSKKHQFIEVDATRTPKEVIAECLGALGG